MDLGTPELGNSEKADWSQRHLQDQLKEIFHPKFFKVDTSHNGINEGLRHTFFRFFSITYLLMDTIDFLLYFPSFLNPDELSAILKINAAFTNTYKLVAHFLQNMLFKNT